MTAAPRPLKLLVVAGEASGDRLGAEVVGAVRSAGRAVEAWGVGGPALRAEGLEAVVNAEALSVMGLGDVVRRLPDLVAVQQRLRWLAERRRPDVALLCDMPDFNHPLGHRLRRAGIPVVGMVAPQAWAWRPARARRLAESLDHLLVLFPFEVPFFEPWIPTTFMGHPRALTATHAHADADALVLMPGSRPTEVARHLGPLLAARLRLERLCGARRTLLPVAHTLDRAALSRQLHALGVPSDGVTLVPSASDALHQARLAVCASGTATLEAALAGVPTVVIYRASRSTWLAARALLEVPYIAMPNLLCGRRVFPELWQRDVNPDAILRAARWVLGRTDALTTELAELRRSLLPAVGTPAERAARVLFEHANGICQPPRLHAQSPVESLDRPMPPLP